MPAHELIPRTGKWVYDRVNNLFSAVATPTGPTHLDNPYSPEGKSEADAQLALRTPKEVDVSNDTIIDRGYNAYRELTAGRNEMAGTIDSGNGYDPNCPPKDKYWKVDSCTGQLVPVTRRRRRKRLLSCSDKADLAFLVGTLGKGSIASTAISSLLAKCN